MEDQTQVGFGLNATPDGMPEQDYLAEANFELPQLTDQDLLNIDSTTPAQRAVDNGDSWLPQIESSDNRRVVPSDIEVLDVRYDDADWFTSMLASFQDDANGKMLIYASGRNALGYFGDEAFEESVKRYFVDQDGRIGFRSEMNGKGVYRYEESVDLGGWLGRTASETVGDLPTIITESVIEGTAGRTKPITKTIAFIASHIGEEMLQRKATGQDMFTGDMLYSAGQDMAMGLLGLGPSNYQKYVGGGPLADTQFENIAPEMRTNIEGNQTFFKQYTSPDGTGADGIDLPLDQAADRESKGLQYLGSYMRNQPTTAGQFDNVNQQVSGVMNRKADEMQTTIGGSGSDEFVMGTDLVSSAKSHRKRLEQNRTDAVNRDYAEAYNSVLDEADVGQLVFTIENMVKNLSSPHAKPLRTILNDLKLPPAKRFNPETGQEEVVDGVIDSVEKLHSIRIYLDQEITNGGFGIAKWLDARKEIDTILKKIPAMQRADSTYQQYTDMLFDELGVYFNRLSKLPDNTRVENLATQFLNSTVSTKSIIEETRRIMKSNPEYAGLWEDLIGLKFGLALDRAFKNPTAETAGMNVWKNLANELADNAPLGKNLRIALNDQPEKLESFVSFVRAARLAGNASNTPSPTQIFQAIEKGIRSTVFGLHQLNAIGGVITLANKANARISENAYREILKKLTSAFMTVKGIDQYNLYTDSFTRALEGKVNPPTFTTINNLGLNAYSASQPEGANADPAKQMMVPKTDRQISAPANSGLAP